MNYIPRQIGFKRAVLIAASAISMFIIWNRTSISYPDQSHVNALVGCYSDNNNLLSVKNGEINYNGQKYDVGKLRYYKDIIGFDSPYQISYNENTKHLSFIRVKNGQGLNVFIRNDDHSPYILFFSADQKREFRFVKSGCRTSSV